MTPADAAVELDRLFQAWRDQIESAAFPVIETPGRTER